MTALKIIPGFSTPEHTDFVDTDAADLASHMQVCASAKGRFFGLQSTLQSVHSTLSPRIVTVIAVTGLCASLLMFA